MRILACVIALAASVGLSPLVAAGAGIPLITHDGRPYVPLDRVAAALRARPDWTSASARAQLVLGRQRVVVTRDRARVQVNGTTLRLSAPAVVTPGGWLVPEEFLSKVVPKIAPRAHLVAARTAAPPRPAIVAVAATREAAVTDLRVRSYPSFTRVVIEADAPFTFRLERVRDGVLVRFEGSGCHPPAASRWPTARLGGFGSRRPV